MFSPAVAEATGPAAGTRSRRRQRTKSSDGSVQQPKAKRQRVPLSESTFVNPEVRPEMHEVKNDRVAMVDAKQDGPETIAVAPRRELGIRIKKPKASERVSKGDGSVVLSTNNAYTVSKLPGLPDRLRADMAAPQHGDVSSTTGYAVTLTHTHAIVWPYASTSPSPETFQFALPYPSHNTADPLPLASLVSPSASSTDPGLVVVMPLSGRITFWESISCAATIDLMRQQRHGVEHSIYGMYHGERVIQITSAESAGFILTMSSGRLALMTVRDSHGRPAISVQFISTSLGASHSGIFGSIRHALTHTAGRGEIAAVRAERSNRVGERNVVAATVKGKLVAWKFHRGGRYDTLAEADVREDIIQALFDADQSARDFPAESFEVLDFTYVPKGLETKYHEMSGLSDALETNDSTVQHLLLLVSLTRRFASQYALVEVVLSPDSVRIGMVRPLSCYTTPTKNKDAPHAVRPRIHLPRPALVAFVIFDRAAVVASIAIPPLSPDSQLQEETHNAPNLFEDVLDLRDDNVLEIVGSGFEEPPAVTAHEDARSLRHKAKNPTAILLVRGAGTLRIATTDVDRFASERAPRVTAKSKLEQAVFYGNKADNPLLFNGLRDVQFSHADLSAAAEVLSKEILSSSSPHIGTLPVSLEENLKSRGQALERLIQYLSVTDVQVDRATRWSLLWNAEKMNVALALWKKQEAFVIQRPADSKKTLINNIVEFINEDEKANPNIAAGEVDRVRHWFVYDVNNMALFVAWAYEVIKHLYKGQAVDDAVLSRTLLEAVTVTVTALQGGLEFREKNLQLYGLEREELEHGVLEDYAGLEEPWTGSQYVSNNSKRLVEVCTPWVQQFYGHDQLRQSSRGPSPAVVSAIAKNMPALTDHYLLSILEQSRWAVTTNDAKKLQFAHVCAELYNSSRHDKILALDALGMWEEAVALAEKHRCWPALADVLFARTEALLEQAVDPKVGGEAARRLKDEADGLRDRLKRYFDKYGRDFAFAAYDVLLERNGVGAILDYEGDEWGYKTAYLRSKPELAKISWINDVQGEQDISHAAGTLLGLGLEEEDQVWSKKIELSLGKLALLASDNGDIPHQIRELLPRGAAAKLDGTGAPEELKDANSVTPLEAQIDRVDRELEVIRIQDAVCAEFSGAVATALDDAAAVELAMEAHAPEVPKKHRAALHQVLESGVRRLLRHEALDPLSLIDVLTLASFKEGGDEDEDGDGAMTLAARERFFLALKVADIALVGEEYKRARQVIWRRCFVRDDWARINDTQRKADAEVATVVESTVLFRTYVACFGHYQDLNEHFKPLAPSACLGVHTDELDRRFRDADEKLREKLLDANKWEDMQLRKYIDKCRLEEWARSTDAEAHVYVNGMLDDVLAEGAAAAAVEEPAGSLDDMMEVNGGIL